MNTKGIDRIMKKIKRIIPIVMLCCVLLGVVIVGMNWNKPVLEAANDLTEQEDVLTFSKNELTETEKEDIYNETMEEKIKEVLSDIEGIKSITLKQEDDTIVVDLKVDTTFDSNMQGDITNLIQTFYSDTLILLNIIED